MISRLQSRETFERFSHFPQELRGRSPHLFIAGGVEPLRGSTCSMAERKLPTMRFAAHAGACAAIGHEHLIKRAGFAPATSFLSKAPEASGFAATRDASA